MPVVKKSFLMGINSDEATYLMDPKEYLRALNIRIVTSENGQVGKVMPVEGTTAITQTINNAGATVTFTLPAGTNQVIGAAEDVPKRRVVWCVWNSNGDHGIYCYDYDTDRVYTVLTDSDVNEGLAFQQDKFIHSCSVVYGLFYWTDDVNQPSKVNIEAGIKSHHPTFVTSESPYTLPLDKSNITVIRPQPTWPITLAYGFSGTAPNNIKLETNGYQASYRFFFRDNEYSTFSTFSKASVKYYSTDIYNRDLYYSYIIFTIPFDQKIPQDVDKVEVAVKYPGSKMSIQKTWTRENDSVAIAAHNAGTTALSFNFFSNSIGVSVDDATTFKAYDSVPLVAKTMEVAKDRLFLANTITGYDSPSTVPIGFGINLGSPSGTPYSGTKVFKSGSNYKFGIVYYDEYGRSCGVVPIAPVDIPERVSGFYSGVNWSFINTSDPIPLWAKSYSIVRTKSKKCSSFFQFVSNGFQYFTKDATSGELIPSPTPPPSTADIYGLGIRASSLYNIGYGYQFTDGDIASVTVSTDVFALKVINQHSDYIIVEYNSSVTSAGVVEVYTPSPSSTFEYYYEIGEKYPIVNPGTPTRSYSVITDTVDGDVCIKRRMVGAVTHYLEVMNMEDAMWQNWNTDAGRGMTEIFSKVHRQETSICFSEVFTTGVNGMSSFNALDYSILPSEFDSIQKIILTSKVESEGSVMLVIGEQETASQYIGESQLFDNTGSSFLAKSSGVLGNLNFLKGSYGTLHPESAFRWKDEVVFFDVNKGSVVRYNLNGLVPISDNKMRQYWKKVSNDINSYYRDPASYNECNPGIPFRLLGMVDPYNEEYLLYTPKMHLVTQAGFLDDVIDTCTLYEYTFPIGQLYMNYTLPLIPGHRYHFDTLWMETGVTYNGQDLALNPYFTAVAGVTHVVISSPTQFGGDFTLCNIMGSYYDMYDGQYGVASYSSLIDKWVTQYSFVPEWMSNISNRLVSFKNGYMHIHNGAYNQFYGAYYPSIITSVHNEDGNSIKIYTNVMVEGDAPDQIHFRTEVPYVQSTNVRESEFTDKEGVRYASILRDRLSPNASGTYDEKMMKGDKMRGESCKFMLVYHPAGSSKELKFINLKFNNSSGQIV